jgi:predicted glycosyltransferase involved in capsule biosynthesis
MRHAEPLITAIVPVRLSSERLYDECNRIERIVHTLPPESFEILIVDYGTKAERAGELRKLAQEHSVELVRADTENEVFSVGHARDIGTQHARTPLVLFHDIDFLMSPSSYRKVVAEARLRNMPTNAYSFFVLPGAYLTTQFTDKYLSLHSIGEGEFADCLLHDGIMRADKSIFSNMTYAISAVVANRLHLLAIGGHDKSFVGHGAEDFDLLHRLGSYYRKGPRPKSYYNNSRNNAITRYEGFRAYFSLYGIDLFQRGLIIAHLDHPRRTDAGYVGTNNQARIAQVMQDYDRGKSQLPPLADCTSAEKTLVLVRPKSAPERALRHAFPLLGDYRVIPEDAFKDPPSLRGFVSEEGFTQVFFLNPYGNEHRLGLYNAIKSTGIRYITYDRGAFPDSWFFDRKGFLGESLSYERKKWDFPLSDEDRDSVLAYIDELATGNRTLEINGERKGAEHLRSDLGVGHRKVLFVALQRPLDTATVHFSGPCHDAHTFNTWVSLLVDGLDSRRYVVVVKKHPLEAEGPQIPGTIFAPDNTNIHDLIDLAEKVIVINSGSGLIAASLGKPVICCGQSFYQHDGFAYQASSALELIELATSNLAVDEETRLRFVHYLSQRFYSFGTSEYITKTADFGSTLKIANRILFSVIRGISEPEIMMQQPLLGVTLDAPLFYSFGGRSSIEALKTVSVKTKSSRPSTRTVVNLPSDDKIKSSKIFQVYSSIYGLFLPPNQHQRLNEAPRDFFLKAKHPVSRFGRALMRKCI